MQPFIKSLLCSSLSCHNNEEYVCDSLKEGKKNINQDPESVNDDIPADTEITKAESYSHKENWQNCH